MSIEIDLEELFRCVLDQQGVEASFVGEMQMMQPAYSDTSGAYIKLRFDEPEDLKPFYNTKGKRFKVVVVAVNDDETIPQKKRERLAPLCEWAVMRCKEPLFWAFLSGEVGGTIESDDEAKAAICLRCEIESRTELDANVTAAEIFKAEIMRPYGAWLQRREVTA